MRVKNTHTDQLVMLPDHGQDRADILNIAQMHGVVDTVFYGVKQQFGALSGRVDELGLLIPDVEARIDKNAADQQRDSCNDDAGCQALEHGTTSPPSP